MLGDGIVSLAPFALPDAPLLAALDGDPETQRWFDWPVAPVGPLDRAEETVREKQARWATGEELAFVIRSVATGAEGLGWVDLQPRPGGNGNVAYGVLPPFRRRGVATRAVLLACRYAFDVLGWAGLEIRVAAGNAASRGVAERAGFVLAETLPAGGRYQKHQPLLGQPFDWLVYRRMSS